MQKKKTKRKLAKKKKNNIFKSRGSIIDKGTVYVVVILTLLIFGGFIMVGGTLPTKNPKENTNLVAINKPLLEPSKSSLQLRTFSGATITPFPTQPPLPTNPLPTDTPDQPTLVDCGGQITGTQEIEMLWAYSLDASPASGNQLALKAFYTNKYALLLGSGTISSMQQHPADHISNPNIGNTIVKDTDNFPLYPAVFLTDITNNPGDTSGDAQTGGQPNKPDDVYGTWKASGAPDPAANNTNLGPSADTWPPANGPGDGPHDSNFTAGIIWKLSSIKTKNNLDLLPGHKYRAQIVLHDGGNPGDIGLACFNFQVPYNGPMPTDATPPINPTLPITNTLKYITVGDPQGKTTEVKTAITKIMNPSDVDFVVFLGDIIGSESTITNNITKPYYLVQGNHDQNDTKKDFLPHYVADVKGFQLVIPGFEWQSFNWTQVNTTKPSVVFTHCPTIQTCGSDDTLHKCGLAMRSAQLDKLNMKAVYGGHTHTHKHFIENGRLYVNEDAFTSSDRGSCNDGAITAVGYTQINTDGNVCYKQLSISAGWTGTPTFTAADCTKGVP